MEVYGIFRNHEERVTIRKGIITDRGSGTITVNYNGYYQSYIGSDIGKILFYTENEAEAAAEELSRRIRWT